MKTFKRTMAVFVAFLFLPISAIFSQSTNKSIELQLTAKDGYAPRAGSHSDLAKKPMPGQIASHLLKGVPTQWQQVTLSQIVINEIQYVYQLIGEGALPPQIMNAIRENLNFQPDTTFLSKKPVQCMVNLAYGTDKNGQLMAIFDADNNLDFSNDTAFTVKDFWSLSGMKEKDQLANAIRVSYERFSGGKIIKDQIPVSLVYDSGREAFMYSFLQHMTAAIEVDGIKHGLAVSYKSMSIPDLLLLENITKESGFSYKFGEVVPIGSKIFKYNGIDLSKRVLKLEEISDLDKVYSTQINYKAIPLKGNDFTTGKEIKLEHYKGKYLFIDFWGTWCGPCIKDMPALQKAYKELDPAIFAILGIVKDTPDALAKYLDKNNLPWPQIIADQQNNIIGNYKVSRYPTTFLLGPDGYIMAQDINGEDALRIVSDLLQKSEDSKNK